ncbi:hypothetical protein [Cytobacillus purgationiresistens]|uniref:Uncharacterized protein n=1 Tax=Cytobacillus purgationiresistens TaxID=863449 RepID=A0ABU0AB94_9BACI|nr:hypothetical protein [Cytobacillus purgationiresistens]MDQ0268523.1 hypothetical protein [Cytobacillus purgationiresistens]
MKKILGLMLILVLASASLFVSTPANAATNSDSSVVQAAPDKIWIDRASAISQSDFLFYSASAYGNLYRGWLSKIHPGATGPAAFSGYIYRSPLPYPTPFVAPIEPLEY